MGKYTHTDLGVTMNGYKIAEARRAKGWSQSDLAEKLGTTQQQISRYESGERDPKASIVADLSATLGVTISYLLGMDDSKPIKQSFVDVPLYGSIAAGTPLDMIETEDYHQIPAVMHERFPNAFLLKVEGESMNKILPNGCYALIDPCENTDCNGAPYAVCVNGYAATVKRVKQLNNGFELVPDSNDPTYTPKTYNYNEEGTEEITVIGKVVYYVLPYDWTF